MKKKANINIFLALVVMMNFIQTGQCAEVLPYLRSILDAQAGSAKINIPKGKYLLTLAQGTYVFSGLKNVTIEGNGSEIVCDKQTMAFNFKNCENVKIQNFSVDYQPLCYTQGRITAISADKLNWDIKIISGYSTTNINNRIVYLFDPKTLEIKKNSIAIFSNDFTLTQTGVATDSTFRITKKRVLNASEEVGDIAVLDVHASGSVASHAIYAESCKNMVFDGVTMYGSNCFSFYETDCENSWYNRCKITRKTDDPTVSFPRLKAGNADGIHSKHATIGPKITNCRLEYNGDDCIAINGRFYPIYKVDEANQYVYLLSAESTPKVQYQDSLVCVDNNGTVKGFTKGGLLRDFTPTATEINSCTSTYIAGIMNPESYKYGCRVQITPWISGLKVGDLVYSKNRSGNSFIVENDTVGHTIGRGLLIKASDGRIKNNIAEGCNFGGIVVSPEFSWMEAGCSSNLEISNNLIKNCLYSAWGWGLAQAGALSVISINGADQITGNGAFTNISIHDNRIEGCPRPSVVLTSIKNFSYYNNVISPDLSMIRNHGQKYGVTNTADFWSKNLSGLKTAIEGIKLMDLIDVTVNNHSINLKNYSETDSLTLRIFNIKGETIYSEMFMKGENKQISKFPAGIYMINVTGNSIIYSRKIIL